MTITPKGTGQCITDGVNKSMVGALGLKWGCHRNGHIHENRPAESQRSQG